jgi:hypothetical protein
MQCDHASDSSWSKELVAHRQSTGRTEGCSDSLSRRSFAGHGREPMLHGILNFDELLATGTAAVAGF